MSGFIALMAVGTFVTVIIAANYLSSRLRDEMTALRSEFHALRRAVTPPSDRPQPAAEPETRPEPAPPPPEPEFQPEPEPAIEFEQEPQPEPIPEPEPTTTRPASPLPTTPPAARTRRAPRPAPRAPIDKEWLEENLTSRWLVWLGGIALALGGIFLVKYSIEVGLLPPAVRVGSAFLLGLALAGAGEWLRRRPLQRAIAAVRTDYVPQALSAAGVITCFGAIYTAYALYDLIPSAFAFAGLALVAAGAVALALGQGPFIAALGLLGAYLVPALVAAKAPSAPALFGYLLIVTVGGLVVVRYKDWSWLAGLAFAGAAAWPVFWLAAAWSPGDATVLGAYLVALFATVASTRRPAAPGAAEPAPWVLAAFATPDLLVLVAAAVVGLTLFRLVGLDGYGPSSVTALGGLAAFYLWLAHQAPRFEAVAVLAAALVVAALAGWELPQTAGLRPGLTGPLPAFAAASVLFTILFAVGGLTALWRGPRPMLWAGISTLPAVAILIIAYWRIADFAISPAWASISLGLALGFLGAAALVGKFRDRPGMDAALAVYAVAVSAAVGLALTMSLEQAWLSAGIALQLPAIAWINGQLKLPMLRYLAQILAAIVLARLVLNIELLDYPIGAVPGLNWMLYGYGLPAAAFWLAARWFRRDADDHLVTALEIGALLFTVLLAALEVRHLVGEGGLDRIGYTLLEQSLNSITWGTMAYGLYRRHLKSPRLVTLWGWRVLGGMAAAQVVFLQCLLTNPLWSGESVWQAPVVNLLLFAYGLPALFAALISRTALARGEIQLAQATGIGALVLWFIQISLEVRHAFHGPVLAGGAISDPEWYAYSAAWLVYAGVLLGLGLWRASTELRYASLVLVLAVVAKVFLLDMAALEGLYRAVSFLGLGASLVGIGFLYQRFVLAKPPPAAAEAG